LSGVNDVNDTSATRLQLPASATLADTASLWRALDGSADIVDASALRSFDTSAIALLLEARRRAEARGAGFAVRGAPPKLVELARLYGVDELLSLQTT
jgi:phospholipid transport system transporter-binding protein